MSMQERWKITSKSKQRSKIDVCDTESVWSLKPSKQFFGFLRSTSYRVCYHQAAFELISWFLIQYGRVNIEVANKKRGIIDHTDDEQEPEPETVEKADTPPMPKKNGLTKKLSVNGLVPLISKESLVLVPEGGDTDHKEHSEAIVNNLNDENNTDQQV